MDQSKLRTIMRAFITSQFRYCPLIWMFHSSMIAGSSTKRLTKLRITCKDADSTYRRTVPLLFTQNTCNYLWQRCIKLKTGLALHFCRKSSAMQLTTIYVIITNLYNPERNLLATVQKASDLKVRSCGKCYHQPCEIRNRFVSLQQR